VARRQVGRAVCPAALLWGRKASGDAAVCTGYQRGGVWWGVGCLRGRHHTNEGGS
jgi:hypothetical protein